MSLFTPKSEPEDDKVNTLSTDAVEMGYMDSAAMQNNMKTNAKAETSFNGFLSAPTNGLLRPRSPDTLSILSTEEYSQTWIGNSQPQPDETCEAAPPAALPRGWRGRYQAFWAHNKGCVYMLVAQLFATLMNVTTRMLEVEGNKGKGLHPFQILFARMTITLVLSSGWMWYKKTPHFPLGIREVRWLLVARGFGGFFGVFGMYYSLLYLPLADATVITFLAPGLTAWACSILVKEPFTRTEQIGGLVSLLGVVLIARPTSLFTGLTSVSPPPASGSGDVAPANATVPAPGANAVGYDEVTPMQRLGAVGISLLGVLGAATAYTTLRWIGKRAHPLISVNYFAAGCTIISTFMQLAVPSIGFLLPASPKEWGYLIFLGICGFIMQFLLSAALAHEKSSRATNLIYTQMLFAIGADQLIFGHSPGPLSIFGSSLILGSAIVVTAHKSPGEKKMAESITSPNDIESGQRLINDANEHNAGDDIGQRSAEEIPLSTVR